MVTALASPARIVTLYNGWLDDSSLNRTIRFR
jgi:hypothetical protein